MFTQWYDFALHVEKRKARPFQADVADLGDLDSFELEYGKRIRGWSPNACLRSTRRSNDGVPDDVLSECLGVPTFSQRFRAALDKAEVATKDIQYLPVHVLNSSGDELKGYAIANVVARVAALDYDQSDWGPLGLDESEIDPATGKPAVNGIWRAALKHAKLKGHDIIRLVEFFPPVFVSERFAQVYNDGGFTGATLTPVIMT